MVYKRCQGRFRPSRLWQRAFPPSCLICRAPGLAGVGLCRECLYDLPWLDGGCTMCGDPGIKWSHTPCGRCQQRPPAFEQVVAPLAYRPPLDHWIRRWKFGAALHLGPTLAALWLAGVSARSDPGAATVRPASGATPEADLLVPVPLHPQRLVGRGFNQSAELGRFLSCQLNIPLATDCLVRTRSSVPQSLLNARDRRRRLRGLFQVPATVAGRLAGRRVALVDDVVTTGSTAGACSACLISAGAAAVQVWAISRA